MCIDQIIDTTKQTMWMIITAIASIFMPVKETLILLFLAFLFNIIIGIYTDVNVNKKQFNIKKAFDALSQLMFYFTCVVFLDISASLLHDSAIGEVGVKWLTCIVVYFYFTNIFRNAKQIFPTSGAIQFIYELLSTEIFDRLKRMVGFNTDKKQ